jgi:hypothetical protein
MYETLHGELDAYASRIRPLLDDKTPAGRDARDAVRKTRPEEPALPYSPVPFNMLVVDLTFDEPNPYMMRAVQARARAADL